LAKALEHAACRLMFSVSYYSFHQLFADLAAADLQGKRHILMNRLLKVDLLVIDDFGFKTMDQAAAERLYAIVDGRFRQRSLILTSDRAIADWPPLFPDPCSKYRVGPVLSTQALASLTVRLDQGFRKCVRCAGATCIPSLSKPSTH
jgi:DNA replication protein DnaC